jgi:hypothetical protein
LTLMGIIHVFKEEFITSKNSFFSINTNTIVTFKEKLNRIW